MTLNELKAQAAAMGITPDEARAHGKLTAKATWMAAIDEVKALATEAQPTAEATATAVVDAACSEKAQSCYRAIFAALVLVFVVIGLAAVKAARIGWAWFTAQADDWLTAQASYVALVLLLLKPAG